MHSRWMEPLAADKVKSLDSQLGIEGDLTPATEVLALFHCHQQLHMDYGFKLLFNVT